MKNATTQTVSVESVRNQAEVIATRWKDINFLTDATEQLQRDDIRPHDQTEATNFILAVFAAMQGVNGLSNGTAVILGDSAETVLAACEELVSETKYHAPALAKCSQYTMPRTFEGGFAGVPFGSVIAKLFLKAGARDRKAMVRNASDLILEARNG